MANTTQPPASNAPSAAASPWGPQADTAPRTQTQQSGRRPAPPAFRRQHVWNMVANIGLVIAILLAGFGAWRIAGEPGWPGGAGDEPVTPQFAMQPSTPVATPNATEEMVTAPPVATPQSTTDCDFSTDIPIFQGVDTSPVEGTSLLLTPDGDVVLTCDEEAEDTTLATGVSQVAPTTWPGTVTLYAQDEPESETRIEVLNLLSGKSAPVGLIAESARVGTEQPDGSPWLVAPNVDDPSQWAIIDLRTMESRLLSDYGRKLAEHDGMVVTGASANNSIAIAPRASWGTGAGINGNVLIIEGSLDNGRWLSLPADIPTVTDMAISADGVHLALRSHPPSDRKDPSGIALPGTSYGYTIVSTADGHKVTQSGLFETSAESTMQWVQKGEALVYTQNTSLMRMTTEMNAEPTALIEGTHLLTLEARTVDPHMVLVRQQPSEEFSTVVPMGERILLFSVNTRTGDTVTIEGDDISDSIGWFKPETRFLVMYDPQIDPDGPITYPVVDATTGEQVGELPDVPLHDTGVPGIFYPDMGPASINGTMDGSVEVIAFDTQHIYLMQMVDEEAQVRQITSPPGLLSEYSLMASVDVSPGGSMLSLSSNNDETRTQWLLPLDGSPDEWIEVPTTKPGSGAAPIYFVPGTGD